MVTDSELYDGFGSMLESIDVPEAPLAKIHQRMRDGEPPKRARFVIPAVAAAALVVVIAMPMLSPGLTQSVETKIAQVLHWSPPPPPPPAFQRAVRPEAVSLAQAEARVNFTITPPTGLPADAAGPKITVAPIGIYAPPSGAWAIGPKFASFEYARRGGHVFALIAAAVSTQHMPPSRYVFEDRGVDSSGNPILVKRQRFAWRNGDQIMTAVTGDGISATEIAAIRTAMHGTPIPTVWPPVRGADVVKLRLQPPAH